MENESHSTAHHVTRSPKKDGPTLSGQSQGRDMQVGRRGTWARGVAKKPLNGKLVTLAYVMRCCLMLGIGEEEEETSSAFARPERRTEVKVAPLTQIRATGSSLIQHPYLLQRDAATSFGMRMEEGFTCRTLHSA